MKTIFKRGITNNRLIDRLNELAADKHSFWAKMIADKDLFIAIRDEYVNVYYNGNSIAKIFLSEDYKVQCEVHYKYLLRPQVRNPYIKFEEGTLKSGLSIDNLFVDSLDDISALKASSRVYAGDEKKMIQQTILSDEKERDNILDLEITFSAEKTNSTDRIDYAKLERNEMLELSLVFYEVKHFSNPAIRAQGVPKVLAQIERYEETLKNYESDIIESYKLVAQNMKDLGISARIPLIDCMLKGEPIVLNRYPILYIGGFDMDQREGVNWKKHQEKLEAALGKSRLKLKG